MLRIYGTCIALSGFGVLLRGPSGSGKSDLALRLIDGGARLVADDQVELTLRSGRPVARAPQALAGLLEVRGLGIVETLAEAPLGLVVDLVAVEAVERLPETEFCTLLDRPLRRLALVPFHASTPAKLRLAAALLAAGALDPVPSRP
jgi:HPr kinase/phosphorylase